MCLSPTLLGEPWLTTADVAKYLDLKPKTVRYLARQGKIKAYVVPSSGAKRKTWRFKKDDVDRAMTDPNALDM